MFIIAYRAHICLAPTLLATLLSSTLLASCTAIPQMQPPSVGIDEYPLSPAEKNLRSRVRRQRQSQGMILGCLIGAFSGAVRPALRGDPYNTAIGAGAGCITGGFVGHVSASYVDTRAQKYANSEARLAAQIERAREYAADYSVLTRAAQILIADEKKKIRELVDYSIPNYQNLIQKLENDLRQLDAEIAAEKASLAFIDFSNPNSKMFLMLHNENIAYRRTLAAEINTIRNMDRG